MVLYKKLVPFVVDDIPPEHKFPGLGPPGPDVTCFKQIYVPGLAGVGNLSNTDKRRWGQRSIVPAHSVLDLKGREQLCLLSFFQSSPFCRGKHFQSNRWIVPLYLCTNKRFPNRLKTSRF